MMNGIPIAQVHKGKEAKDSLPEIEGINLSKDKELIT